jgi:hypothetical protein
MSCGIYSISSPSGKEYIGSSSDVSAGCASIVTL